MVSQKKLGARTFGVTGLKVDIAKIFDTVDWFGLFFVGVF